MKRIGLAVLLAVVLGSLVFAADAPLKYPETRRGEQVDDYHGTKVADPYRWLEDDVRTSPRFRSGWTPRTRSRSPT